LADKQWTEHDVGPGSSWVDKQTRRLEFTLGPDYYTALEEIIEAQMLQHHDEHTDTKQHLEEFLTVHEKLRADYWQQLRSTENHVTQYRRTHDMRPFNWSLETRATVLSYLGLDAGKARVPRTIEQKQHAAIRAFNAFQKDGVLETKIKPEYQGANHPLEQNQIIRN
jgi:hypothetical protein